MSPQTDPALSALQGFALRQFRRWLELNADIDRNRSDSLFARDGTIHYILDQNVFEMFVQPAQRAHYVAPFSLRLRDGDEFIATNDSLAAQSAMIASEWLLSGDLPGQRGKPVYMTEWHHDELDGQIHRLREELARKSASGQDDTDAEHFLNEIEGVGSLMSAAPAEALARLLDALDPASKSDVERLQAAGWPVPVLTRSLIAREIARLVANDPVGEPYQQLDRILSREIAPRLRPLHFDFKVPKDALPHLRQEAKDWYDRLVAEREQRQARGADSRDPRSDGTLKTDARSLAYILWVALNHSKPQRRFVLVTGDSLLFDAYRRWHAEHAQNQLFILRRPVQYAPFFNFNEAASDAANAPDLFERVREALEVPLLVFNLGTVSAGKVDDSGPSPLIAAQRELLSLRLLDPDKLVHDPTLAYFLGPLGLDWWQDRKRVFQDMRRGWTDIERVAIGASFPYISRRLKYAQRMRAHFLADAGALSAGGFITNYARKLLDRIVENTTALWLPIALDFIRDGAREWSVRQGHRRAPVVLRLQLASDEAADIPPQDIQDLLTGLEEGHRWAEDLLDLRRNPGLATGQHIVFAIAACFALRLSWWARAHRWADFATDAAQIRVAKATQSEAAQGDLAECRYLRALTERFRLGSISPWAGRFAVNHWDGNLRRAVADLDASFTHHIKPPAGPPQLLRMLRAMSERAACRLFYATWLALPKHAHLPVGLSRERGLEELRRAGEDLTRCRSLAQAAHAAGRVGDERYRRFLAMVEAQFVVNSAAAEILLWLYREWHRLEAPRRLFDDEPALRREIDAIAEPDRLPHPARIDLEAYRAVILREAQAGARLRDLLAARRSESDLLIDTAFAEALREILPRPVGEPPS